MTRGDRSPPGWCTPPSSPRRPPRCADHGDGLRAMGLGGARRGGRTGPARRRPRPRRRRTRRSPRSPATRCCCSTPRARPARSRRSTTPRRSYAAIAANILANLLDPQPDSVMLHAASLIHASGTFVLPYWLRGGASAVLTGFEPGRLPRGGRAATGPPRSTSCRRCSACCSPPAPPRPTCPRLRTVVYGASPMPRPVIDAGARRLGPGLPAVLRPDRGAAVHRGARRGATTRDPTLLGLLRAARASTREVRLADEDGTPRGRRRGRRDPGARAVHDGRLPPAPRARPPRRSPRTAGCAPATWPASTSAATSTSSTGTSDMIVTGGYNVYPREVEDALMAHPAVAECRRRRRPRRHLGRGGHRLRQPRARAPRSARTELRDAVRVRLAGYKVPKTVALRRRVPKSPVGKMLRRALRDPLWEGAVSGRASVRVERDGPVTTVDPRPAGAAQRRRRADGAPRCAEAFRAFDADPTPRSPCCTAPAARSAPAPTSRRSAPSAATAPSPTATGPMGPTRLRLSKPVIAAVEGYAVAGGLELALWCDLRVADEIAVFGVFCRRWGVPLIDGGTVRLPRLIGTSRALDMILTGRPVDAAEALRLRARQPASCPPGTRSGGGRAAGRASSRAFPQTCLRNDRLSAHRAGGARRAGGACGRARGGPGVAGLRRAARRGQVRRRRGPARVVLRLARPGCGRSRRPGPVVADPAGSAGRSGVGIGHNQTDRTEHS